MNDLKRMYLELLKQCLTASCYDESFGREVLVRPAKLSEGKPVAYVKESVRRLVLNYFRRRNIGLVERFPVNLALRREGHDRPLFGYSMVGHQRLDNIQFCVEQILEHGIPGDFIETGVWRGGTVILMAALLKVENVTDRKVWAADSFEGMPVPVSDADGGDHSEVDSLKVSVEQVKANFARFDLLSDQVQFLKGWFSDSLPTAPIEKISLLRLDCDLYSSTMDALQNLHHKVSSGGYVIVDDYYSWPSCRAAVTDFLKEHNLDPEIVKIDWASVYWQVK